MLDVVTVAAIGIERALAFGMSRDGIGLQRMVRLQPLDARERLFVARRAAVVDFVLARSNLFPAGVQETERIVVAAVEAIFVLRHFVSVAVASRVLAGDHRDVSVLVAWNDPFQALDEHLVVHRCAVDDDRIFNFLDRLPAPHSRGGTRSIGRAFQAGDRDAVDGFADRVIPVGRGVAREIGTIVAEAAVAIARTAMVAEREPIETEIGAAAGSDAGRDRTIDRVAGRNRTVGAGIVVVHIAGDIGVAPGLLSSLIVVRSGVRQSQRDRSRSQQNGFSRWKHVVAPLRISMRTKRKQNYLPNAY